MKPELVQKLKMEHFENAWTQPGQQVKRFRNLLDHSFFIANELEGLLRLYRWVFFIYDDLLWLSKQTHKAIRKLHMVDKLDKDFLRLNIAIFAFNKQKPCFF